MSGLIQQYQIELSKARKEFKEHRIKIARLFNELQLLINPFFGEDVASIKAEEIEQIGDELVTVQKQAVACAKKIKDIEAELA